MQVFISYSSDSKKWADRLADALRDNGITPWMADEKLPPGVAWQAEIEKAVKSSNCVVGLFDSRDQNDPSQRWKWAEILDAILEEKERPLIPILLNDAELPGFLHSVQAIRVKDPSHEWDEAVESLIEVLKKKKKLDEVKLAETVTVSAKAKSEQKKRLQYIGMVAEYQKSSRKGSA